MGSMPVRYDAVLLVSFGGPEGMDDVMPFLANVVRGRNVPPERLQQTAAHYAQLRRPEPAARADPRARGGARAGAQAHGPRLPGLPRQPQLAPVPGRHAAPDGGGRRRTRALAFFTSAYGSYSGCRQYLENIEAARAEVGAQAPEVDKLRAFYNHPGFVEPLVELVGEALGRIEAPAPRPRPGSSSRRTACPRRSRPRPLRGASCARPRGSWPDGSGAPSSRSSTRAAAGRRASRGSSPTSSEHLRALATQGVKDVVVAPIGFLSDHMEVVYDLDTDARARAVELGLNLVRAATVGTHPRFVRMIRELVVERIEDAALRPALGARGPAPDECAPGCCVAARPRP
jgi:ferrochelatase